MRGELPEIEGSKKPLYENYKCLSGTDNMFLNFINDRKIIKCELSNNKILQWFFREYKYSYDFINFIKTIEKDLYLISNNFDKEIFLIKNIRDILKLQDILDIYKFKKINENIDTNCILLKKYINILIDLYNNLNKQIFKITRNIIEIIFNNIKNIIINYSGIHKFEI